MLYYVWHPPSARRKQKQIEQLRAEVDAAAILIDPKTGQTFQWRDGQRVCVPQSMVPKKVRANIANPPVQTTEHTFRYSLPVLSSGLTQDALVAAADADLKIAIGKIP